MNKIKKELKTIVRLVKTLKNVLPWYQWWKIPMAVLNVYRFKSKFGRLDVTVEVKEEENQD